MATKIKSKFIIVSYLFAILVPILGLIESIIHFRSPIAKNLFWIFCMYYGLVHIYFPEGYEYGGGADSIRYAIGLEKMQEVHLSDLFSSLYSDGGTTTDIYILIITFAVSIFTSNAHFLFFVFALIFGYFLSRNIWFLIDNIKCRFDFTLSIFLIVFALITPIWQINGVRMWTALHVFLYGLLPYLLHDDHKKLIWCYCSFLIHFSFLLPIAILVAYLFLQKKPIVFLAIFLLSLTVHELDLSIIKSHLIGLGGGAFDNKISVYANEDTLEQVKKSSENHSFHVILAKNLMSYTFQALLVFVYFQLNKFNSRRLTHLFCISALFYSFANIMSLVPSGGRFIHLAQLITILPIVFTYTESRKNCKKFFKVAAWLLVFPIIFLIRAGMDFWGLSLLFGNPITCWLFEDNIPLINYIKK